ncbi:hypothetical protein H2200_001244 [Cladophialophora chaetospira]|uniref:Carboxylic ester hydrolase n=1 Tax=Cladophialophora chaetospira TaxID=386627 RepID=A0AA38XLA8_9EURO|nr:hypothetical protein H2200_001244 [Cladophialophora chaetospira]
MTPQQGNLSHTADESNGILQFERTPIVQTTCGPIRGFVDDGMNKFLGIPFAAPPVGDLRWRPPISPETWERPLDAVSFGPLCAQTSTCFPGFGSESSTEDCLYLNVFTPEVHVYGRGQKLPVMVFIHGGGFSCGASNDYNPTALVNNGNVVFVSLNYRVGIFGFFSHPAINAEGHPAGNYGIMDQQFALRWVQQNIGNFGGDASNVTVFGESAGGASTLAHVAAPSSRGLFHKAIIQSGGSPPTMPFPTIERLEAMGTALASAAGCTEQTAGNLRRLTVAEIMAADALDEGVFGIGKFPFGLMEDGVVVPKNLRRVFSSGEINAVPMIVGGNRDEFTWFQAMMELRSGRTVSAEAYPETLAATVELLNKLHLAGVRVPAEEIPRVLKLYPVEAHGSASRALAAVVGDAGLISTACRRTIRVLAQHCPEIYAYEFDVPDTPCPWPEVSFPYGSAHTLELPYIFPGFRGVSGRHSPLSEAQQRLAREMVQYWAAFAWHGTPNGGVDMEKSTRKASSVPTWEVYNAGSDNIMLFQAAERIKMIEGWGRRHRSDYWDQFY